MGSHDEMFEFSDEMEKEIDERWMMLANMNEKFYRSAISWWNFGCTPQLRQLIVGAAYYESMAHEAAHADEFLEELLEGESDDSD